MDFPQIIDFLKHRVELFRNFPPERLEELARAGHTTTFEPNEAIIECGEEGRFLGVLLAGKAEVSIAEDNGERRRLAQLEPGSIFGEMSLMTGDKTVADVIALSPSTALLIPDHLFSSMLAAHPSVLQYLSKLLSERVRSMAPGESGRSLSASALKKSRDPYGFKLQTPEPMRVLVINCGSSSLKYNLFDTGDESRNARGLVERIGQEGTRHVLKSTRGQLAAELPRGTHREAFAAMVAGLTSGEAGVLASVAEVSAVGHRVVHGGDHFSGSEIITPAALATIEKLSELAPLHNPVNVVGIKEAQACFPSVPHVAVFDTSFHHTLPPYAFLYGLPYECYDQHRIRRYGFHGMSHFYVALKAAEFLRRPFAELEIISCHLGNGASLCAIDHGRSIDTSMGMTPLQGLVMGTRSGDVDPGALTHLMRIEKLDANGLDDVLNKKSGLKGLSGFTNDMREIEQAAQGGNYRALLAFKTFCYQIRKYIGAYVAAMHGLDVLVFTGGIGQGSVGVRSLACQGLEYMGIRIDESKNRDARGSETIANLSAEGMPVQVLVIPTNEELMIARETLRVLQRDQVEAIIRQQEARPVPIEIQEPHVHLSAAHLELLFGAGYPLQKQAPLSLPGQFVCREKVTLAGPKGQIENVTIHGPAREATQVEITMAEQFQLGVQSPLRESGDLDNTPGLTLKGPAGSVALSGGVISNMRHLHMSPEDVLRLGLRDRYVVRVKVRAEPGESVIGDVLVRVTPDARLALHLSADDARAAGIRPGATAVIDGIESRN